MGSAWPADYMVMFYNDIRVVSQFESGGSSSASPNSATIA